MPAKRFNRGSRAGSGAHFVRLDHYMLKSPAWLSLSPFAVAAYVLLATRFNGSNNGDISLSVREIDGYSGMSKSAAARALSELQEKGFVRLRSKGSFTMKAQRLASTWALTCYGVDTAAPTKDFMRWQPPPANVSPAARKGKPKLRLVS